MPQGTTEKARSRFTQMYAARAFQPVARFISNKANEEDVLADAVAQTYEMDARYAAKGKVLDPAILVHSCRLRAIDPNRRFVKTDAQPARDALHQPNFTAGKVEVYRLDGLLDPDTGDFHAECDRAVELGLVQRLTEDPTVKIISAIDLTDWMESLDVKDQNLLAMRMLGFTLEECAEAMGMSTSTAFKRLANLGHELADRAGIVITKKPRKSRSRSTQAETKPLDA